MDFGAHSPAEFLDAELAPLRERLLGHSVYQKVRSLKAIRLFMEHHVFAVWDFMSLLKALQVRLTCVHIPWIPSEHPVSCRLINEIVLDEESDTSPSGYSSHFDLYRDAMDEAGADLVPIRSLLTSVSESTVNDAVARTQIPPAARRFVEATFEQVQTGSLASIAGAFALGREDMIPGMFRSLIDELHIQFPSRLNLFRDYLHRHVSLDEERHTPMAMRMLEEICKDNVQLWKDVAAAGRAALESRIALWDDVAVLLEELTDD